MTPKINVPVTVDQLRILRIRAAELGLTVPTLALRYLAPIWEPKPARLVPPDAVFPVVPRSGVEVENLTGGAQTAKPSPDVARRPPKAVPFKPRQPDPSEAKEAQEVRETPRKPKPLPPEDVTDPDVFGDLVEIDG